MSFSTVDVLLICCGAVLLYRMFSRRSPMPLPPGPKKLPLLGNLLDMPKGNEWITFADWGKKWGNMISISVFGQQYIIINSAQTAVDLLDKKSSICSDRPVMQMGSELVGWKNTFVFLQSGPRFNAFRKLFHQLIGSRAAMSRFHPVEEMETHRFLKRLLTKPKELSNHVRWNAGAIILRISHGYAVKDQEDPFVTLAEEALNQFSLSTAPGGFLVNLVPSLRHIPEWFPGAGFKKTAKAWAATLLEVVEKPHQFVKQQMSAGTAEVSFTSNLLEEESEITEASEFDIKWSAASLYSGGADTTVAAIYAFFKAMALHPEVQVKAQAEIDSVIGNDRLPTFEDRDRLPYINAVVLEAMRWHTVTPTGVPHRIAEDVIHDGYLIPKDSLVITNIWQMTHDPTIYPDPFIFNPNRFLGPTPEPDPKDVYFGFGRRICPGRVLADASLFITCAMTLAVFNFSKLIENGKEVEYSLDQTTGTISHTATYQCNIQPRSQKAVSLILSEHH